MSEGNKQRSSTRFDVALPVEFRNLDGKVSAEIANISTGGMCIRTAAVLPANTQSFFRIKVLDQPIQYNVEAEVVWSEPQSRIRQRRHKRPGKMGLRFVKSRFLTEEAIDNLIEQSVEIEPASL